jgi:phage terminase small subunit
MSRPGGLIAWQWATYDRNHRDRLNLVLHFVAVPAFIAGVLSSLRLATLGLFAPAAVMLGVAALAFLVQGIGHRREAEAPIPFSGPLDVVGRILVEQFITFPRFVFTGGWARNLAGRHTDQH